MTQDRELAEVLALLEKATPGEWREVADYPANTPPAAQVQQEADRG